MYVIGDSIKIKGTEYIIEQIRPLRIGKGTLNEQTAIASLTVRKGRGKVLYNTVLHVNGKFRGLVSVSRLSAIEEAPSRQPDVPGGIVAFLSESRIDALFSILMFAPRVNTTDEALIKGILDELHIQSARLFAFSADEYRFIVRVAGEYLDKMNPRALRAGAKWFANGFAADPAPTTLPDVTKSWEQLQKSAEAIFDDNVLNVLVTFDGSVWHLDVTNEANGQTLHEQDLGSTYAQAADALNTLYIQRKTRPVTLTPPATAETTNEEYTIRLTGDQLELVANLLRLELVSMDYTYDTEEEVQTAENNINEVLEILAAAPASTDAPADTPANHLHLSAKDIGYLSFMVYEHIRSQHKTGKPTDDAQRIQAHLEDEYERLTGARKRREESKQ